MPKPTPLPEFLVAPSEPALIKAMGRYSAMPEKHGADILWFDPVLKGIVGVQRKAFTDLLGSVEDGRLQREVQQLQRCKVAVLIVEGAGKWVNGMLMDRYNSRWSRAAYRSLLRSVQGRAIFVEHSDSVADTVVHVEEIRRWVSKGDHTSLDRRPKPKADTWGHYTDKAWACHLLQSIDGIGPKQAEAIWTHFGNRLPLSLDVTREELLAVPGFGDKKVALILKAFRASTTPLAPSTNGAVAS